MTSHDLRGLLLAAAAGLACSSGPRLPHTAGPVSLEVGGAVEEGPFRLGEAEVAALPQGKVQGVEPRTGKPASYEGLAVAELEERVQLGRGVDTLVFRSAGGEAMPVPRSVVHQLRPVLAARADGAALAGRVLAWPNIRHHGLTTDPRAPLWWVRDVVKIEFIAWADVYGKALAVPAGAPRGALAGARSFGTRCIGCHAIRGTGGARGPALGDGGPFTEPARLAALLADHPGAAGPNLAPPGATRVEELATFLRVISEVPADDDGGEEAR